MLEMLFFDRVGRVSYARPRVPLSASYILKRVVIAVIHVVREYISGRRLEELPGEFSMIHFTAKIPDQEHFSVVTRCSLVLLFSLVTRADRKSVV